MAADWRDTQAARAFLDALKAKLGDQVLAGAGIDDWVGWAEKCLAEFDPINRRSQDVFSEVAEVTDWTYRD